MRDRALFAGGLATAIAGGVTIGVGEELVVLGYGTCMIVCMTVPGREDKNLVTGGALLMLGGALLVAIGIPLAVSGGRRVSGPQTSSAPFEPVLRF